MKTKTENWIKEGRYLPPAIRDFHDQKDLFKAIHQTVKVEDHEYCGDISWIKAHIYVVDIFLHFMAQHGYTLQKARHSLEFKDLDQTCMDAKEWRMQHMTPAFMSRDIA